MLFLMKFLVAIFLAGSLCATGAWSQELPEQSELQSINEELQQSKLKLKKTKEEEQAVLGRLAVINKELRRTRSSLYLAQRKIRVNESQIGNLTSELDLSQRSLREKERKFRERIKEVYKSSGLNHLQLLLTSSSMADFFNRVYFLKKIVDYDAGLVKDIRTDVRDVKQKRSLLRYKTREIRGLALEIAEKKEEISAQAEEKNKVYKSLQQRRKEYEERVAELEKSSKELEVMILKKIAARKGSKVYGSGTLDWPVQGRITSGFGYRRHPLWGGRHFHTGVDLAAKFGSPIKAADSGEVIFSGWWDGYGKAIVVDHGRMTTTVYAHLSRIYKKVGAVVAKGQVIGLAGSTGYSTGPHLHFEVRKNGKPINPMKFLK
jgi:murein DD-endopeptidase MepM/ murein hydrolase activator NlpD